MAKTASGPKAERVIGNKNRGTKTPKRGPKNRKAIPGRKNLRK